MRFGSSLPINNINKTLNICAGDGWCTKTCKTPDKVMKNEIYTAIMLMQLIMW